MRPALEHTLDASAPSRLVCPSAHEELDDKVARAAPGAVCAKDELLGLVVALGDRDEHAPELLDGREGWRRGEVRGGEVGEEHGRVRDEVGEGGRKARLG